LNDCARYFIQAARRLASESYLPTDEDILRARLRTTSVGETTWVIERIHFRMVDVGGQRGERSKWLHCFEDVTAVIFCASMSGYDQVIREDQKTNRLHESLNLFKEICKSKWLKDVPIILFLNKKDLFQEKIRRVDLSVCFPEYKGGCDYRNASKFILDKFQKIAASSRREFYPQITTATDTENVIVVWGAVKDIVLQGIVGQMGFGV